MALLVLLPFEIKLKIFEDCQSFADATNLSSTCKILRYIWNDNRNLLAFTIALRTIPAFDDALITVRATAIAKRNLVNLISNDKTPSDPSLVPSTFSYRLSRPSFSEIISVTSLYKFVDCAVYLARNGDVDHLRKLGGKLSNKSWRDGVPYAFLPSEKDSPAYRYRVFSSMYRVFMAGAMLSWAHLYPIFKDDSPLRNEFRPSAPGYSHFRLTQMHTSYLRDYLPFQIFSMSKLGNPTPPKDYLPFAEYLMQKGRDDFELHDLGSLDSEGETLKISVEEHKEGSTIQQFWMLQTAFEILRRLIADKSGYDSHMGRIECPAEVPNSGSADQLGSTKEIRKHKELKLELFMFGSYQPEIFTFPSSKQSMKPDSIIYAEPGKIYTDIDETPSEVSWNTFSVCGLVNSAYREPGSTPGNSYIAQVVESLFICYCLRRLLELRIDFGGWFLERSEQRAQFLIEGKAFQDTKPFIPRKDLVQFPLLPPV